MLLAALVEKAALVERVAQTESFAPPAKEPALSAEKLAPRALRAEDSGLPTEALAE